MRKKREKDAAAGLREFTFQLPDATLRRAWLHLYLSAGDKRLGPLIVRALDAAIPVLSDIDSEALGLLEKHWPLIKLYEKNDKAIVKRLVRSPSLPIKIGNVVYSYQEAEKMAAFRAKISAFARQKGIPDTTDALTALFNVVKSNK